MPLFIPPRKQSKVSIRSTYLVETKHIPHPSTNKPNPERQNVTCFTPSPPSTTPLPSPPPSKKNNSAKQASHAPKHSDTHTSVPTRINPLPPTPPEKKNRHQTINNKLWYVKRQSVEATGCMFRDKT
ncbi:hypothetical protein BDU57DRAFT_206957 [Ampelomyces quisqualis]|uniref:Uncharacterized protein n=1 Tax=Ampelomyces quisqualis TaxID=50730 RepID=A0A6A5QMV0_AMPQU|nr:hypothetical protein BDU57DRAFT_206957 [Ampelomyces quisqualis]